LDGLRIADAAPYINASRCHWVDCLERALRLPDPPRIARLPLVPFARRCRADDALVIAPYTCRTFAFLLVLLWLPPWFRRYSAGACAVSSRTNRVAAFNALDWVAGLVAFNTLYSWLLRCRVPSRPSPWIWCRLLVLRCMLLTRGLDGQRLLVSRRAARVAGFTCPRCGIADSAP